MPMNADMVRRLMVAVDAAGYGGQDETRQAATQGALVEILDRAAVRVGLNRADWVRQPGGDGELSVLPVGEPETVVVDDFVRAVAKALAAHNEPLRPEYRMRLRLAVHHGVATPAANGFTGQGPVVLNRLLHSAPAQQALAGSERADLVLVLSDRVFEDVIVQRRTSLRSWNFRKVAVQTKELRTSAWLWLPDEDVLSLDLSAEPETEMKTGTETAGVQQQDQPRADSARDDDPADRPPSDGGEHYQTTVHGPVTQSVIGKSVVHHHRPA